MVAHIILVRGIEQCKRYDDVVQPCLIHTSRTHGSTHTCAHAQGLTSQWPLRAALVIESMAVQRGHWRLRWLANVLSLLMGARAGISYGETGPPQQAARNPCSHAANHRNQYYRGTYQKNESSYMQM